MILGVGRSKFMANRFARYILGVGKGGRGGEIIIIQNEDVKLIEAIIHSLQLSLFAIFN